MGQTRVWFVNHTRIVSPQQYTSLKNSKKKEKAAKRREQVVQVAAQLPQATAPANVFLGMNAVDDEVIAQ